MNSALRRRLALFDLDHTLLPLDSDHEWGEFTVRLGWHEREAFTHRNDAFFADYLAGKLDVHAYVAFSTAAIVQRGPQAAHAAREQFMREVIRPALHPAALELVEQHRHAGDIIIITSATNEFVTTPIAQAFGADVLLSTQLARDDNGWYTGRIQGEPNLGEGKITSLHKWLMQHGLDWASVHTTFYSDSPNDLPLLEKVNTPVATNPGKHLRTLATMRGWRVIDLFK